MMVVGSVLELKWLNGMFSLWGPDTGKHYARWIPNVSAYLNNWNPSLREEQTIVLKLPLKYKQNK